MSDIDITQDLVDGSNGALGDAVTLNNQGSDTTAAPAGTQHVHGDAQPVNKQVPAVVAPGASETTLRDQLSNAFKAQDGQPTDQANAQTAAPVKPEIAVVLTQDGDGKFRLPDGTFASTEQVTAFQAARAAPAPDANAQQAAQSPVYAGLTPAEQQQFQSLPAELRTLYERTMEGLNTRAARYGEYDQIEQHIIGPRREAFAREGNNPVVALNQLFTLSDFAGRDPGGFVMWYAQQHNLDLDALQDARDAQQSVDPAVRELQGQVQQLTGNLQQFQQRDQHAAQQANYAAVETFATEKGADGVLKRPYITDVMDSWATQITAVRAANPSMTNPEVLDRAYQNACWSDPAVRGKMQQASQDNVRQQEAAKVQAAKNAGASVTGAPAGDASTIPNNTNRTLRDELETAFAEARAI